MIVVLSGGAGGGRFCRGVVRAVPPEQVTIIGNTADDIDIYGVRVSPDLDLITFTLAGVLDQTRGYGLDGDPREVLAELARCGVDTWFDLGDRDLAVCMARTSVLRSGGSLSEATRVIADRFGSTCKLLPMTDDQVFTQITTADGPRHFQRWWVHERAVTPAERVEVMGIASSAPAPGVIEAIHEAEAILIAPSNPVVSIGPILQVPGIRDAIAESAAPVVAVSPIVSGGVLRGMADKLMAAAGLEVSAAAVAELYGALLDGFVLDERDSSLSERIRSTGIEVACVDTIMTDDEATTALAKHALDLAGAKGRP